MNGSITVNDNGDGLVAPGEIDSWVFTSNVGGGFSIAGASAPLGSCENGCFVISGSQLLIGLANVEVPSTGFSFISGAAHVRFDEFFDTFNEHNVNLALAAWYVGSGLDPSDFASLGAGLDVVIASSSPNAQIPESSTLALLGIALAAFFGFARRRPGLQQSTV